MNRKKKTTYLPYGRQCIEKDDIEQVVDVMRSGWLTTGPKVEAFERQIADFCGVDYSVAVNSGTAALHCAMNAVGITAGDEVVVPPITFAATANAVVYQGGVPVFADVLENTLLIDPDKVEQKITPKTKAIAAVDYAGQMCDYDRLREIADKHNIFLISDACHSIGAEYKGALAGQCADLTVFSFHPVKHITTGEGGVVVTNDEPLAEKMKRFRNHGINTDLHLRNEKESWVYEIEELGYNYRITDLQCALGISQLKKLPAWLQRRRKIAEKYNAFFKDIPGIAPLAKDTFCEHAYHLYVIRLKSGKFKNKRYEVFKKFRGNNIGVNVHYIPVYFHPFYKDQFGMQKGLCPVAEKAYEQILSLPVFPGMTDNDLERVCEIIKNF